MSECVSANDILGLLRQTLPAEQRALVEQHVEGCAECLELVTLAAQTSLAQHEASGDGPAVRAGTMIGRYEVRAALGNGGMGMVYAAHDGQLDRPVALKLVHPRLAGDPRAQVALLREAQAMARITQPNVLTVYELGTFADAVFLAAERVDGVTLDRWLATPRRWRAIVDVFLQAAHGLEAAHAAALVHRDFKPSNVLVGDDDRVRVFDFGLVRFADSSIEGRELVGTPLYMAPEQLRGELATARSDQYAWCAALHEALFGELPTVLGAPLPATRGAANRPPRWLREVIMRGLAQAPEQRYRSLHALRVAIDRGLARRRRRIAVGLAALATAAACTTAGLGYARGVAEPSTACDEPSLGWTPARQIALAGSFTATGLAYAPATWLRVERVLDGFAARWHAQHREVCRAAPSARAICLERHRLVFEAVLDRLAAPDRELAEQVPQLLASLPDVATCVRAEGPAAPLDGLTRARLAIHLRGVARVISFEAAGHGDDAARELAGVERMAATLGLPGAEAEVGYLAGKVAARLGHYGAAATQLERALWAALAVGYDELALAASSDLMHVLAHDLGRPVAARGFADLTRAAAERIGSPAAHVRAGREIGYAELMVGHHDVAEAELRAALAITAPPDNLMRATILDDLAIIARRRRQFPEAEVAARQALEHFAGALGTDHPRYAVLLINHALSLDTLGRSPEAVTDMERALAVLDRILGPDHPDVVRALYLLGEQYNHVGQPAKARHVLERALAICARRPDDEHLDTAPIRATLADTLVAQGELAEAARILRTLVAQRRALFGATHHATLGPMLDLATAVRRQGGLAEARQLCTAVLAARPSGSDEWPAAQVCLADLAVAEHRVTPAVRATLAEAIRQLAARSDPGARATLPAARFTLATTLPAHERSRARALATQARDDLPDHAHIDAWLRDH